MTGAQVVALGGDAAALESGQDNSALGVEGWEPVSVDRVVEDGDTVTLEARPETPFSRDSTTE